MTPRISFDENDQVAWEIVQHTSTHESVEAVLDDGYPVTTDSLRLAHRRISILGLLLESIGDPNATSDTAETAPHESVAAEWMTRAISAPSFRKDEREWYPLQFVAYNSAEYSGVSGYKEQMASAMTELLNRKADIYAILRQPMRDHLPSYFPGDAFDWRQADSALCDRHRPPSPPLYGLRSVVHAILEDGQYCQPLLCDSNVKLDVEHRDPQGRTLLLSACRSALGIDAAIDGVCDVTIADLGLAKVSGRQIEDPFTNAHPTIFEAIQLKGANMLATDLRGKTALHHLFEAHDNEHDRAPIIRKSVQWIFKEFPVLVNQKDHGGMHPLCSALQRMRRYIHRIPQTRDDAFISVVGPELEAVIFDMLDAGADPLTRDIRGNTAIHYLAACGLADRFGVDSRRELFRVFLARGVDVNARNQAGQSALEILLADGVASEDRERAFRYTQDHQKDLPQFREIDAAVFTSFDEAGVRWTEQNATGQNLLHVVASYNTQTLCGPERIKFLLAKGLDPKVEDNEGKTAIDIAEAYGKESIIELLRGEQLTYNFFSRGDPDKDWFQT